MKTKARIIVAAALGGLSLLAGCMSPMISGGASAVVSLEGLVLPSTSRPAAVGPKARALLPSSTRARVRFVGEGFDKTLEAAITGATITMSSLPAGVALAVTVDALDSSGAVVTSGSGTATLSAGANTLSVTLSPPSGAVTALAVDETNAALLASPTLATGGAAFYRLSFGAGMSGEMQVLFDTGKARWAWMGVYDADWKPVTPIASDPSQGWAVLDVTTTKTYNVALANAVSSPGYPSGSIPGKLSVRPAIFFAPGAAGSGTSADPAPFDAEWINNVFYEGGSNIRPVSFILSGGLYVTSGMSFSTNDQRYYGSFTPGDWNSRTGATTITSTSIQTMNLNEGAIGTLDKLILEAANLGSSLSVYALSLTSNSTVVFVINDCTIRGNQSNTEIVDSITSTGVISNTGSIEIANCILDGGIARSSSGSATSSALVLSSGTLYVHNSTISGGRASSYEEQTVMTIGIRSTNLTSNVYIACCEIWGGSATQTIYGTPTTSVGLELASQNVVIANSRISGGRTIGIVAPKATGVAYTLSSTIPALQLFGNTIDGGYVSGEAAGDTYSFSIDYNAAPGGGSVSGNAFFISGYFTGAYHAAINRANTGTLTSFANNMAFSARGARIMPGNTYADDFTGVSTTLTGSQCDTARMPSFELINYSATPESFADFLAQDWRPAAGALYVGKPGMASPFTAAQLESYPALGLDLAGRPRPASGPWGIGAYEP